MVSFTLTLTLSDVSSQVESREKFASDFELVFGFLRSRCIPLPSTTSHHLAGGYDKHNLKS